MTDAETIRRIEREVLDREFQRYRLLWLPEDLAITRMLKIVGDFSRMPLRTMDPSPERLSHLRVFSWFVPRGLSHCLRWISQECQPGRAIHGPHWRREDDEAAKFLNWGMVYGRLATDHVAWS